MSDGVTLPTRFQPICERLLVSCARDSILDEVKRIN